MNNLVKTILEHPIATIMVVGCFSHEISNIISVSKGHCVTPIIQFTLNKGVVKNEQSN